MKNTIMANVCCMNGCTVEPAEDVYYFKLPTKPALRRRWLEVIKPYSKLSVDASVCSVHFATSDYETVRGKTRLKKNKVPMKIEEKTHHTDFDNSECNKPDVQTDKALDIDSNSTKEKSQRDKETNKNENGTGVEKLTECSKQDKGDELGDKTDSQGEEETGDQLGDKIENERQKESGGELGDKISCGEKERLDTQMESQTVEINGAQECHDPSAVEIQVTPDFIEDYDAKPPDPLGPDINHDIEDILTNYHIMNPPSRRDREQPSLQPEKPCDNGNKNSEKPSEKQNTTEKPSENPEKPSEKPMEVDDDVQTIADDDEELPLGVSSEPVFIEIPVDKGRNKESGDRNDCLMVLESLQVSIDPNTLVLPDQDEIEQIDIDDDKSEHDGDDKNHDPISLLTSSDEDEVIIEEPHIDTVEVSDETDEDDVPLMRLVKSENCTVNISKLFWGAHEYYCKYCNFATFSSNLYRNHVKTHNSTAIQICQVCGFTTASEYQFSRHKKKHKDDKKYKCHLCDYKARHNMSLIYHLKTHDGAVKSLNKCQKCGFKSSVKSVLLKHVRMCKSRVYKCAKCRYSTKRNSDLKRHVMRKHAESDDDAWTSN